LFTAHFSIGNALNAVGDVPSARDEFQHALGVFEGSVGFPAKLETDRISLLFELACSLDSRLSGQPALGSVAHGQ
jgi:hypothetical protein